MTVRNEGSVSSEKLGSLCAEFTIDRIKTDLFLTEYNIVSLYAEADSMPDLIHYLVDSLGGKDYVKLAIGTALQYDTVEWARAILDNLELEDENDTVFYDYYDVAVTLAENSLTWFGMNETQKNKVRELSLLDYEVSVNAQAVLTLVDDSIYFRIPEMAIDSSGKWDGEQPQLTQEQTGEESNELKNISVYPNPSSNSFNVNYLLEKEASEIRIEVYDLTGRTILFSKTGKTSGGNINLDFGECLGIYILRMFADERQIHTEKLVCIQR